MIRVPMDLPLETATKPLMSDENQNSHLKSPRKFLPSPDGLRIIPLNHIRIAVSQWLSVVVVPSDYSRNP